MKTHQIVYPSSQVDTVVPQYIYENYTKFVTFMSSSDESEERIGFGQDILQNLQKYRNFDTYKNEIVQFGTLNANISATDDELTLTDGYGFPEENGVLLIGDEVILYTSKEDNTFYGLQRGASGTTVLPTLRSGGTYVKTVAASHSVGDKVTNISVLFLVAMLENIHGSFAPNIDSGRIDSAINRSSLLQNIRDFFGSKGSKLGIKSLFKMLFGQNDVEVNYPGDRMLSPSDSSYVESVLMRVVPFPRVLTDTTLQYVTPDKMIGAKMSFINGIDGSLKGTLVCDYCSSYPFEDQVQYEVYVDDDSITGDIVINPGTNLTRAIKGIGTTTNPDETTVTVESTLGFPQSGIIYIDAEVIQYTDKTFNQFLNCKRGYEGVHVTHEIGANVYGPYYLECEAVIDGVKSTSRSWPLGLVRSVDVNDPGILHQLDDEVYVNGPGDTDNREPSLRTFLENQDDILATQADTTNVTFVGNFTQGISGVYFDDKNIFISSTNLPGYAFGGFSTDGSVGPALDGENALHILPRYDYIELPVATDKMGTGKIAIMIDGVPAFSPISDDKVYQGAIHKITVNNQGRDYITPTVLVNETSGLVSTTLTNGKITEIVSTTDSSFTGNPTIRVTSGENGGVSLTFDAYGRVTGASITNAGRYYLDTPSLVVVDGSGRGRGALMKCTVSGGAIVSVDVPTSGLDYNPATTYVSILPIGAGCTAVAEVQYYQFERKYEIDNKATWKLDKGNAFLFPDEAGVRSKLGYLCNPVELRDRVNDTTESQHSPLLGWAIDGNPIYGPYGYSNLVDDSEGFKQQFSSYRLRPNRDNIVVGNDVILDEVLSDETGAVLTLEGEDFELGVNVTPLGTNPPSTDVYPMGTFVEDYFFDPENVIGNIGRILTEYYSSNEERLLNQSEEELLIDGDNNESLGYEATDILDTDNTIDNNSVSTEGDDDIELQQNTTLIGQEPALGSEILFTELSESMIYDGGGEWIMTQGSDYINYQFPAPAVLDENNGKVCNTPEFPVELYPDGVYCYFTTHFNNTPRYPYFVGPVFKNRPQDQKVVIVDAEGETVPENPDGAVFDYMVEDRYRTPISGSGRSSNLSSTKEEVVLEINDVTTGSVSGIYIEDGAPITSMVNDLVSIDDTLTLGNGAVGKVSHVQGKTVNQISGSDIATKLISHKQRINLSDSSDSFVFVVGSSIETSGGSEATVVSYDSVTKYLDVQVTSERLIQFGETFYDNRETLVTIGTSDSGVTSFNDKVTGGSSTFISYSEPGNAKAGDLWWSSENGRLYIYYIDADSAQWISANPVGMRPLAYSSNVLSGFSGATTQNFQSAQGDRKVTISNLAPDKRTDGTPNLKGDLWWSPHTAMLYIWYDDRVADYNQGSNDWTGEWVATDPSAGPQSEGISGLSSFRDLGSPEFKSYQGDVTVLVSETAPVSSPGFNIIAAGTLWWSPISGKLYIYFVDSDETRQWVTTNPTGTLSGPTSVNKVIVGDGGEFPDAISILPETKEQTDLWFESLRFFEQGDTLEFQMGAPGNDYLSETVILREFIQQKGAKVTRSVGDTSLELRDGALVVNKSRSILNVTTDEAHGLLAGDTVEFSGSSNPEVNTSYQINTVGEVEPATVTSTVIGGVVTGVTIVEEGAKYTKDFYVSFYGGGGQGAYAFAKVKSSREDGGIESITMIEGGVNYTSAPTVVLGDEETNRQFSVFTDKNYGDQTGVTYSTTSTLVQGNVAKITMASPGNGYDKLPKVNGVLKKEIDRAKTRIDLSGTTISGITVLGGGKRYVNPVAVISDLTNNGSGATASVLVENQVVTSITVTNPGINYVEPYIELLEQDGKFVCLTEDIGKIKSVKVLNPGRNITVDRTTKPEIQIESRFVVSPTTDSLGSFNVGQTVFQGASIQYQAWGEVTAWDSVLQILTIKRIEGTMKVGEVIQNSFGTKATVLLEGQPDTVVVIDGTAEEQGRFVDDSSMVSASYAHIQDSEYYQRFSYEIESTLQQVQYETFVRDIIHPVGFALFSSVRLNDSVVSGNRVEDVSVTLEDGAGPPTPVLGIDTNGGILGLSGYTGISVIGK